MKIWVNGEPHDTGAKTVAQLLEELSIESHVATAMNEDFVPSSLRATTDLLDQARIEVLSPKQGG